jgi:nucleoside-diphosphate-sugar epimerase
VVALSRDPDNFLRKIPHLIQPELSWAKGSVIGGGLEALEGDPFDFVVHLATEANMTKVAGDPEAARDVIVGGTRNALALARRLGAKRVLFTSSGAVYGRQPPDLDFLAESHVPESSPARLSAYSVGGEAKRQAEMACMEAFEKFGLGVVIARCFTFGGPGLPMDGKFAFGNFMRDALAGAPIAMRSDGESVRSYMYSADLAVWLWILLVKGVPGRAYNVGSEWPVSVRFLAESIARALGTPGIELEGLPGPLSGRDRYVPSTLRARSELGLNQGIALEEIITRTAAWHSRSVER